MPDPTNLDDLRTQWYQEHQTVYRRAAVEHALLTLDPTIHTTIRGLDYPELVECLRAVLVEELERLTAPPSAQEG